MILVLFFGTTPVFGFGTEVELDKMHYKLDNFGRVMHYVHTDSSCVRVHRGHFCFLATQTEIKANQNPKMKWVSDERALAGVHFS